MIEFFLRRPVLSNLITLVLCVVGGYHFFHSRREAFPDIKFDMVLIQTPYPGASPEEVETLVTRKIEDQVRSVSGVDRAESWSLENLSVVLGFNNLILVAMAFYLLSLLLRPRGSAPIG